MGSRRLGVHFNPDPWAYWRLWQVGMLLTLLTLGLYRPFAKVRQLQFLYAHLEVDGHALHFDADPWRMLRGFLLMALLAAAYFGSGLATAEWALVIVAALALLWPLLWRSGLRFRLARTHWRGLPLGFAGSLGGAYLAMLPWAAVLVVYQALVWLLAPDTLPGALPDWPASVWFGFIASSILLFGLGQAWVKRYQHNGYRWGDQQLRIQLPLGAPMGLAFKYLGLFVLLALVAGAFERMLRPAFEAQGWMLFVAALAGTVYLAVFVVGAGYYSARLQNMVWNASESEALRFHSRLSARRLALLNLRNWVLIALTLGSYRPFALLAVWKMRLGALQIEARGEPGRPSAHRPPGGSASGEMAGEFFDLDLGW